MFRSITAQRLWQLLRVDARVDAVTPAKPFDCEGQTEQFTATGKFSDN